MSNIADLKLHGCRQVRYLPFGYDEHLIPSHAISGETAEGNGNILFVGGADRDRVQFFSEFVRPGLPVRLVGSYWDRNPIPGATVSGPMSVEEVLQLTRRALANICLVRRANRDGHVMRSFEIAAAGGFLIAEDTTEHRDIFGKEGECVLYFATPQQAAEKVTWAIENPAERLRMAQLSKVRIRGGKHSYRDRLRELTREAFANA